MPKSIPRAYSRYTHDALSLLAGLMQTARKQRKLTVQEVAERAGISRGLLQRIEKGNPKCEIGVVFEVAAILDIRLFDAEPTVLSRYVGQTRETLALLPKSIRHRTTVVDDDF